MADLFILKWVTLHYDYRSPGTSRARLTARMEVILILGWNMTMSNLFAAQKQAIHIHLRPFLAVQIHHPVPILHLWPQRTLEPPQGRLGPLQGAMGQPEGPIGPLLEPLGPPQGHLGVPHCPQGPIGAGLKVQKQWP